MGNSRQCPPVVKRGKQPDIVSDSIINGESWMFYKVHHLTKNGRVARVILRHPDRKRIGTRLCILAIKVGKYWHIARSI